MAVVCKSYQTTMPKFYYFKLQVIKVPLPSLSGMTLRNPQTSQEKGPSLSLQPPKKRKKSRLSERKYNSSYSIKKLPLD